MRFNLANEVTSGNGFKRALSGFFGAISAMVGIQFPILSITLNSIAAFFGITGLGFAVAAGTVSTSAWMPSISAICSIVLAVFSGVPALQHYLPIIQGFVIFFGGAGVASYIAKKNSVS